MDVGCGLLVVLVLAVAVIELDLDVGLTLQDHESDGPRLHWREVEGLDCSGDGLGDRELADSSESDAVVGLLDGKSRQSVP